MPLKTTVTPPPPPPPMDPGPNVVPIWDGGHPTLTPGGPLGEALGGYSGGHPPPAPPPPTPPPASPLPPGTPFDGSPGYRAPKLPPPSAGHGAVAAKVFAALLLIGGAAAGGIVAVNHFGPCPNGQCAALNDSAPAEPAGAPVDQAPANQAPANPAPVNPAPVANYYLHFSCGTSRQCAQVIGYSYGIDPGAFHALTKAQCDEYVRTNAMGMTPWDGHAGTWCSTNRQPSTQPP